MAVLPMCMRASVHLRVQRRRLALQGLANIMADGFAAPARARAGPVQAPGHLSTEVVDKLVGNR